MGGDTISTPASSIEDEDLTTVQQQFTDHFSEIRTQRLDADKTLEVEANQKRIRSVYAQVFKNYDELKNRVVNMEVDKSKILSYTPGSWIENVGGMTINEYNVPQTTTLLLIGPKGAGKSSLVNRISRVFEEDKFAPERAQVTYNSSITEGTSFLQEYMIPRNSTSLCLYDTRGFSNDLIENYKMIKKWMTKGVRHGKLVKSESDGSSLLARIKSKTHKNKRLPYERRKVNFVIYVVNGLTVLKCMDTNGAKTEYTQMIAKVFRSSFLSFKDQKPAIAITHGDLLSLSERARVRVYLGELLGVHPSKQTFDIPDDCEPTTELTIVDLVRYGLQHSDRNLPRKSRPTISKGPSRPTIQLWSYLLLLLGIVMFIFTVRLHGFDSLKVHPESVPEPTLEIKKVIPESIPDPNLEIKKVIPENIYKPSVETKTVNTEKIREKKQKIKKVRTERHSEPTMEIDWKTIRHLW